MPLKYTVQDDKLLLSLRGSLTIFQAAERKPELLHALTMAQRRVVLDMSGIDEIDTAGIQLLLLLRRELLASGRLLEMEHCSAAVMAVLDLLQLHERFSCPVGDAAPSDADQDDDGDHESQDDHDDRDDALMPEGA